ncbi:Ribonuclease H1 [Aphelenchoides avenae]|nr:Ribonuclease H1 [Aphelenchus avenae]
MLEATIAALRQVEADGLKRVTLRTNSRDFANSIRRNLPEWAKNGFTTRSGKPLMHRELFREVYDLLGVTEANIEFDASSEGIAAAVDLAAAGAEQFTPENGATWVESAEKSIAAKGTPGFYAVRYGRVPGVYGTYRELQENTGGYKFAAFKKFDNERDAWKFVNGEIHISKEPGRTATFYAVQVGRKPGVFRSWDECLKQIEGYPHAIFKKFTDEKAARDFVKGAATSANPETPRKKD